MTFRLKVIRQDQQIVEREYEKASECCKGFIKALEHFVSIKEPVTLNFTDELGRLIYTCGSNDR